MEIKCCKYVINALYSLALSSSRLFNRGLQKKWVQRKGLKYLSIEHPFSLI